MNDSPTLYGAPYSTYTRSAIMALVAKNIDYRFETVDIFAPAAREMGYQAIHPFMKIPALRHGDFTLYETGAINRYVDEAFPGPSLQPDDARLRARMNQGTPCPPGAPGCSPTASPSPAPSSPSQP